MKKDARFYFANLGADVARCVQAAQNTDTKRYDDALNRARRTLGFLREASRPEAYEEGLLLLRGLEYARRDGMLAPFLLNVQSITTHFSPLTN